MGAAREDPPLGDSLLYLLVSIVVYVVQLLHRLRGWALSIHQLEPKETSSVVASIRENAPAHIAFTGSLVSHEQVSRLARDARKAGATVVTVHVCGCYEDIRASSQGGGTLSCSSSCTDTTARNATGSNPSDSIHPVPSTCSSCVLTNSESSLCDVASWIRPRFPGPSTALVEAAKWLADTPPSKRDVDISDVYSTIDWLDRDPLQVMLPSEPDVLLVFMGKDRLRSIHGFPAWQLRLTQICFIHESIETFTSEDLLRVSCAAARAPKRFGT